MVQIAGTYDHVKNENFVEHMLAWGAPEDRAKSFDALKPKLQIAVDGKKISVKLDSGDKDTSSSNTYVLDEEVDEQWSKTILKSTAKLSGNTLTINSKSSSGRIWSRTYDFSDSAVVVTMSSDANVPTAKRFFKRI